MQPNSGPCCEIAFPSQFFFSIAFGEPRGSWFLKANKAWQGSQNQITPKSRQETEGSPVFLNWHLLIPGEKLSHKNVWILRAYFSSLSVCGLYSYWENYWAEVPGKVCHPVKPGKRRKHDFRIRRRAWAFRQKHNAFIYWGVGVQKLQHMGQTICTVEQETKVKKEKLVHEFNSNDTPSFFDPQ